MLLQQSCDSGKVSVLLRCWLDLIILQERVEPLQQILRDLVPRLPDLGRQEKGTQAAENRKRFERVQDVRIVDRRYEEPRTRQ